jgi:hypothetical protein
MVLLRLIYISNGCSGNRGFGIKHALDLLPHDKGEDDIVFQEQIPMDPVEFTSFIGRYREIAVKLDPIFPSLVPGDALFCVS